MGDYICLVGRSTPPGVSNSRSSTNSHYYFNSWGTVTKFKELLPQESRAKFSALVKKGKPVVKASLQAALDGADSAARTMGSAVVTRRSSWLQTSGLPYEVQQTIQDLPFEGTSLFSEQTDSKLHSLKGSRATLKSIFLCFFFSTTDWKQCCASH